ncbi:hypothetical protein V0M98_32670 (plasmid) [Pseudomonas silesiensis]|uniref:hypothetical protein n=1 Tax=Pseudomonas silesiensis TaxID=1853130 RepID=UPI0030CC39E6
MSQQSAATSSASQDSQTAVNVGHMWWRASDQAEAETMKAELLEKGVIEVRLSEPDEQGMLDVFFTLDRDHANEILGYEVGDEEWLEVE